jgi:hypothetical protein
MGRHPTEVQTISLWGVFEGASSLDIVISIQQADGIRRLTLIGQQSALSVTSVIENQILYWLDNLSSQPTIDHPD